MSEQVVIEYNNPPADGFDVENSNVIAVLIADQVMNAMGGRAKWDSTNVFFWNFFGKRTLLWDKENNKVRIDEVEKSQVAILDMNDHSGKVWQDGVEVTDSLVLEKLLIETEQKWMNDSYWLFMPFKLKDSGVTLTYFNSGATDKGEPADIIGLAFKGVGVTPDNAYRVWVSVEDKLVKQWAYYKNFEDDEPKFTLSWDNYQSYNGLLLASERGERAITDIKVLDKVPEDSFDSPEQIFSND